MIEKLSLYHYLDQPTYTEICGILGLSAAERKIEGNWVTLADSPIRRVHLFNIEYQSFGRVWFMHVDVGFADLQCGYEECAPALYRAYRALLGEATMASFPAAEHANCDYVEYTARLCVADSDAAIEALRARLAPEQLSRELWGQYVKAHGTVALLLCRDDAAHLSALARCHGTALKRILKDATLHRATGIALAAAVNRDTERLVLSKQLDKHVSPAVAFEVA